MRRNIPLSDSVAVCWSTWWLWLMVARAFAGCWQCPSVSVCRLLVVDGCWWLLVVDGCCWLMLLVVDGFYCSVAGCFCGRALTSCSLACLWDLPTKSYLRRPGYGNLSLVISIPQLHEHLHIFNMANSQHSKPSHGCRTSCYIMLHASREN